MKNCELVTIKSVKEGLLLEFLTEEQTKTKFVFSHLEDAENLKINGLYSIVRDSDCEGYIAIQIIEKNQLTTHAMHGDFDTIAEVAELFATPDRKVIVEEVERYKIRHQDYGIAQIGVVTVRK